MENSMEVPQKKLKTELPYNPAIPLLGIFSKYTKTLTHKDTCTPMFTALFTIARIWKQPKCPPIYEYINIQKWWGLPWWRGG